MNDERPTAPRALLSVSDKTGLVDFARGLAERGWELLSTGGTAAALRNAGLDVLDVAEVTGHPEMMDGRVKTLHPAVHAGVLARRDRPEDLRALEARGYRPIDLVAVNLYPFRETVARTGVTLAQAMEKVDIGGPTMLRAAAKSHRDVWVVVDPGDYGSVLQGLGEAASDAERVEALRRRLAAKVFRHVSSYDAAIAAWLERENGDGDASTGAAEARQSAASPATPDHLDLRLSLAQTLRYGENPDQQAGFYRYAGKAAVGLAALEQHHGKELSYNNLLDLDGALLCLSPFARTRRAACVIVKHTTPAGLAVADTLEEAYRAALRTDPASSFGSVIAVNRTVDRAAAEAISDLFVECLVAPSFDAEAMEVLARKKNVRLLTFPRAVPDFLEDHGRRPEAHAFRSVYGGALLQTPPDAPFYLGAGDEGREAPSVNFVPWRIATARQPTPAEWDDLRFAWAAVYGVKSNAILLARDQATLGVGAGQMSRVDASRIAVQKAGDAGLSLEGAALASDAFFPFRDGVDAAAEAGVRAIVQPGGSVRDEEVVAAADEHDIAMVFTGRRLFRH